MVIMSMNRGCVMTGEEWSIDVEVKAPRMHRHVADSSGAEGRDELKCSCYSASYGACRDQAEE